MSAAQGFATQLGIDTNATVTKRYDFLSESMSLDEEFVGGDGLRGELSHAIENLRQGTRKVGGQLNLRPTAVELAALLPHIMGAAGSGTTYAFGTTFSDLYVVVDRVAKVFSYSGCQVDKATFKAQAGGPLLLTLDMLGIDESVGNAGTFPSLSLDTTTGFFMFSDLVLSIGGTGYSAKDFELMIDYKRDADRVFNSNTRASTPVTDRIVTVNTNLPYGDATAVYATGVGGVAVTATFTNGNTSLVATMPKVAFPRQSPTVGGKQEIMLPLSGQARKSGSTSELVFTLDSTP